MRSVITKFLTFKAENVIPEIYIAIALVYFGMLFACMLSIYKTQKTGWSKFIWMAFCVFIPIMGMFIYSAQCMLNADFKFLKEFGLFSAKNEAKH